MALPETGFDGTGMIPFRSRMSPVAKGWLAVAGSCILRFDVIGRPPLAGQVCPITACGW